MAIRSRQRRAAEQRGLSASELSKCGDVFRTSSQVHEGRSGSEQELASELVAKKSNRGSLTSVEWQCSKAGH